jgi:hypothetical protein
VRNPSYRPATIRPTGDAGKRIVGSHVDRRNRSRVLLRNRSVEYVSLPVEDVAQEVSGASDDRMANIGTRKVLMREIPTVSGQHPQSDRFAQLPSMFVLQRDSECLHGSRCVPSSKPYLLLRRRSEFQQTCRALCILIPLSALILAIWILFHPSPL